ncbi:MAG TPA: VIT1/CCC1 family protein [Syntrophomonadaceae bacterium]|nr:VIT1/CCC1 family protein [Syntrophomonadaceae bacterium]
MEQKFLIKLGKEQRNEITSHHVYNKLAIKIKSSENSTILHSISADELKHYHMLKEKTGVEVRPDWLKIYFFYYLSLILGLTFGIKLLERDEDSAIKKYNELAQIDASFYEVLRDEEEHEKILVGMINEERLRYMGSIVLGLNDALVELTGALAGYTFAFQNARLIALTGLITGIAASFSMASAEYLSSKQDNSTRESLKSALYTGAAYVITVLLLILPYLLLSLPYISLGLTLTAALLIIFLFNFYVAVAKDLNFKHRFIEMAVISLGVAAASFLVGIIVKKTFGIDI